MKLPLLKVRVLLLISAGAIINALLGWGSLAYDQYFVLKSKPVGLPTFRDGEDLTAHERAMWSEHRPSEFMDAPSSAMYGSRWGHERTFLTAQRPLFAVDRPEVYESGDFKSVGWPMRSFEGVSWFRTEHRTQVFHRRDGIVTLGRWQNPPREISLPVRIMPTGFIVNSLLFATVLWLLLVAPFDHRRRRRIKRGQCPACAYPVGSNDTCTECGRKLRHA